MSKMDLVGLGKSNGLFKRLKDEYNQPGRFYHNWNHIEGMIESLPNECSNELFTAILFHDIFYKVGNSNNEQNSYFKLMNWHKKGYIPWGFDSKRVHDLIMLTKDHDPKYLGDEWIYTDEQKMVYLDLKALIDCDFKTMKKNDRLLFREFQKTPLDKYKSGRQEFLFSFYNKFKSHLVDSTGFYQYIKNLNEETFNVGVYCGSFNPMHIGHMNIIEKAEKIFDKVIIGVGQNPEKQFDSDNYNDLKYKQYREVVTYKNILELFKTLKQNNPNDKFTLIRGMRNEYDHQAEETFRTWVKELSNDSIDIVYFFCDKKYEHISSSGLKNMSKSGFDVERYLV